MKELINESFDGYCPESRLAGKKVRMRLNRDDFFESEETGLQISLSFPGAQAVIMKSRGDGKFRHTVSYADEVENGELLSPQTMNRFPFCDEPFMNGEEIEMYIEKISRNTNTLPYPTKKLIQEYLEKASSTSDEPRKDNKFIDYGAVKNTVLALEKLISQYPSNTDLPEIYLKVTAINSLYSTNIYDTYRIAYKIKNIENFTDKLNNGDPELVNEIAKGHGIMLTDRKTKLVTDKERNFYSFATKYCSWHDQKDAYPIYDSYIDYVLKIYLIGKGKKIGNFKEYQIFKKAYSSFIEAYELNGLFKLKELDKFFWLIGQEKEREHPGYKWVNFPVSVKLA